MENFTNDSIDELLIKYLAGEASTEEQLLVQRWLQEDVSNKKYFNQLQLIWEGSKTLQGETSIDEDMAWHRFQQRIQPTVIPRPVHKSFQWMRVAVAIIIIAGAALFTYRLLTPAKEIEVMMAVATVNEVRTDTLPDGSTATLNKHSKINYPSRFKGATRPVKLEGEAFFHITPDKARPFIISVNDVEVKVVGTSFNIKNTMEGTEVIVATGVVEVTRNGEKVQLHAGERVLLENANNKIAKESSADQLYNYYVSHSFVCDNTPLWKLVDKLNEAYGVNITIARKEMRRMPLTVTFDEESLDVILDIIRQTLLVKITRSGKDIIIN